MPPADRAQPASEGRATLSSLHFRNFRLYFIGQTVSGAGSWMQNVATGWFALELTHSGLVLGIVTAARFAPPMLFGVWTGIAVDRTPLRGMVLTTQSVGAVLSLLLAVLTATGLASLTVLLAVVLGLGFVDLFDVPARQSIITSLVDRGHTSNAVGLSSVSANASRAIGPGFAGLVIETLGVPACFFINTLSYSGLIIAMLALRTEELFHTEVQPKGAGQIRAGLSYVWRTPDLRTPLIMVAVTGTFTWEYPVTLPVLTSSTFHSGAGAYGLAIASLGVGAIVGGLLSARQRVVTIRSLALSATMWGAVNLAVAASPSVVAVYVIMFAVGLCAIVFNSAAKTLLQLTGGPAMRGRVMSLWFVAWQGSTTIGAPIVGGIANRFGGRYGLVTSGVAAAVVGLVFLRRRSSAAAPAAPAALTPLDEP